MVFLVERISRSLWIGGATRSSWSQACSFCYVVVQFNEQKFGFALRKWLKPGFIPGSSLQTSIFPYTKSVCVMLSEIDTAGSEFEVVFLMQVLYFSVLIILMNFLMGNLAFTLIRMLSEPGSHPGDDVWCAQSYQRCLIWHNLAVLCAGCNHIFKYIVALCVQGKSLDLALSRHLIFKDVKALTVLITYVYV